ncbi:MAG: tRNA (adenosine(37)-N6)-threonylcarbamoyltransferase complex dimerization subunit type 1 TsaB [Actinobacteria bacterium]|nr:tRNA (adenosine(37)-N6)-threonylcarbamoyltransferase complex dimerization subunit type 1 TsaB [Actinomycetota bacterium]
MTISLAIDTSTSRTSVAIVDAGALLWHGSRDGATAHGDALPALVQQALGIQNSIDQVVVGMGPGPYTGLRVGIAFARAFALARTIGVIGICSLDAIAAQVVEENDYIIATDARRKEVYWAKYVSGKRIDGPAVEFPLELSKNSLPIFGEGAIKYGIGSNSDIVFPDLVAMVRLSENSQNWIDLPMYLRRPDAVPTSERIS